MRDSAPSVLTFGWEYPPAITGGLGTACRGLVTALAELGCRVVFVAPRLASGKQNDALRLQSATDVDVPLSTVEAAASRAKHLVRHIVDSPLRPYATASSYSERWRAEAMHTQGVGVVEGTCRLAFAGGYGPSLLAEVERYAWVASTLADRGGFDLIHAHDWMTFPAAFAAKARSGKPMIAHFHALEYDRAGADHADERVVDIERHAALHADLVLAVSQRTASMLVARYGADPSKIRVVHNGVESPGPVPVSARGRRAGKLVTFLGRLTMQKGPDYFLEAAFLVARARPDTRFVMAGSGHMRPQLLARMADLDLSSRFHFAGFVDEDRRATLFSETDCFVMPSVSEPFGLTPVEALQYGVPVVVSKQSGVAEVLKGALKVDFWDVRRMADVIINILASPALSQQLGQDGMRDVRDLSWQAAARRVLQAYSEVAS